MGWGGGFRAGAGAGEGQERGGTAVCVSVWFHRGYVLDLDS